MTFIFVNTYTTLLQGLYFYLKNPDSVIVIDGDYFPNSEVISKALNSRNINAIIDRKNSFLAFSFGKRITKSIIYNFFRIFKDKKINKIYYNGDPSTSLRLKALASSNEIIFLDAGYQHYFLDYMSIKNNFYKKENAFLKILRKSFFGFRLNYKDSSIKEILFIYEKIFHLSNTIPLVKNTKKERFITNLNATLKVQNISAIFLDLFPKISQLKINNYKNIIIITQPFFEQGYMSLRDNIAIYEDFLISTDYKDFSIYLKIHPAENPTKYLDLCKKFKLNMLDGFPLELLEIYGITFSSVVSYNSTASYLDCFEKVKFLDKTHRIE